MLFILWHFLTVFELVDFSRLLYYVISHIIKQKNNQPQSEYYTCLLPSEIPQYPVFRLTSFTPALCADNVPWLLLCPPHKTFTHSHRHSHHLRLQGSTRLFLKPVTSSLRPQTGCTSPPALASWRTPQRVQQSIN